MDEDDFTLADLPITLALNIERAASAYANEVSSHEMERECQAEGFIAGALWYINYLDTTQTDSLTMKAIGDEVL